MSPSSVLPEPPTLSAHPYRKGNPAGGTEKPGRPHPVAARGSPQLRVLPHGMKAVTAP